jgi:hypothetical protein
MATPEQIAANQSNAQKSTGPKTEAGKANSSQNGWKHGLFGVFRVLATEDQYVYDSLLNQLIAEHNPTTPTEAILVENMAQHHWLRNRALYLQHHCFESEDGIDTARLNLFMRYESMHERAYHKCMNELSKLRAEKQKQEIGFASHLRKQELHVFDLLCCQAEADYQKIRAISVESDMYRQDRRVEAAIARENREEAMKKAA